MGRFPRFVLPAQNVDEGPFVSICVNDGWRALLLALIERLEWSTTWEPETDMTLAESNAFTLALQIANANPASSCGPPTMCDVYGAQPPSWETISEDYFACYGEELVMPLEFQVSAACGLEYRQSPTAAWTAIPGAQFLPLDATCDLNGGLKIRSDDPAKKSLDVLHPVGNTQDVVKFQAANGGHFYLHHSGVPVFIHPNGNVVLGTAAAQWNIAAATNIRFFSNQANAYSYSFDADGAARLGQTITFNRLWSGIGAVQNGYFGTGLSDSTYATRKGFIRAVAQDFAGERVGLTVGANGSASTLRFYDSDTPVPRPTVNGEWNATGAGASLAAALASMGLIINNSTIGNSPDGTVEMRVFEGWIQWRSSPAGEWINLITLAELEGAQGPQGIQGAQGPQGIQGEQGPQGLPGETTTVTLPPGVPPADGYSCNIAGFIADRVLIKLLAESISNKQSAGYAADLAVAVIAGFAASAITGPGVVVGVAAAVSVWFLNVLEQTSIENLQAAYADPALAADLMCAIYCGLDGETEFTLVNTAQIMARINAINTPYTGITSGFAQFMADIDMYALNSLANVGVYYDAVECAPCECEIPEPLPCVTTDERYPEMNPPNTFAAGGYYDTNNLLLEGVWSGGYWSNTSFGDAVYVIPVGGYATYTLATPIRLSRVKVRAWELADWPNVDWPEWDVIFGSEVAWNAGSRTRGNNLQGGYNHGHEKGIVDTYGHTNIEVHNLGERTIQIRSITLDACFGA